MAGLDTEESTVKSAEWNGEETEELASEEESKTAGGTRESGLTWTSMAGK